eukprot:403358994
MDLEKITKSLKFSDFEIIKNIGQGNFTTIHYMFHKKYPNKYYAIKICDQQKVKSLRKETDVLMEKHALNKVKLKCRETGIPDEDFPVVKLISTFKDESSLYFLTELLPSKDELWEHCRTFGLFDDQQIRYTFYQICKSVAFLHDLNIVHRDLKPENMFYAKNQSQVKLIDLGSAEDLENAQVRQTHIDDNPKRTQHVHFVGTPQYMAPECVRNQGAFLSSDIWSLGVILYQLYLGLLPFRGKSDYLIFIQSTIAKYRLEEYPDILIPQYAKELIQKMIQVDKEQRFSISQVLEDKFFQEIKNCKEMPQMNQIDLKIKEVCNDFIQRGNVFKFDGEAKFEEYFEQTLKPQFYELVQNSQIESVIQDTQNMSLEDSKIESNLQSSLKPTTYTKQEVDIKMKHIKLLAKNFIFDIEPYPEDIEMQQDLIKQQQKEYAQQASNDPKDDDLENDSEEDAE